MNYASSETEDKSEGVGLGIIAKGGALILIGSLISIIANFAYQFLLARLLGPAEVGNINLGISVITLVSLVMVFGLDRAVVRYVAHYLGLSDRLREVGVIVSVLRVLTITTLIVTPLFLISADFLANKVFHKPDLQIVFQIMGLGLPFIALTRVLLGIAQAYKKMTPILAIDQIAVPIFRVVGLSLLVFLLGATGSAAALSFSFAAVLGCIPAAAIARRIFRQRGQNIARKLEIREILQYAWLAMLSIILNRTNTQTETLILGAFSTSEQVGIYTVGLKATILISIILDAIGLVFTPFIAELYAKKDLAQLNHQFKTVTRWAFTLALPVAIILFVVSPDLMSLLGQGFESGTLVMRILVVAQITYVILGSGGLILVMTDYNRLNTVDAILNLVTSLVLDLALIPRYGAVGAAVAGAITIIFVNLLRLLQIHHIFNIQPYNNSYLKPFVSGLFSLLAAFVVSILFPQFFIVRLILVSGITLIVYFSLLLVLRLDDVDRQLIANLHHRLKMR